ncbi:MAG: DUF1549 domain-containing protein [Pirellulales bacterium]
MVLGRFFTTTGLLLVLLVEHSAAGGLEPHATAGRVDELLAKESFGGAEQADAATAPRADDQTMLRRLALDLVGQPPTPEEITAYALDTSPEKQSAAVERLLADKRFGENWAYYWRDVIMYRRSEERALQVAGALVKFLADEFNGQPHWDQIARRFIVATGDIQEEGATAIIMAQMAVAEDTTAEVSRIFMGIQIQCAQCHNHPTDRWKREQFHELAAFFPRISIQPVREDGKRRSFAVVSADKGPKKKGGNARRGSLEHYMPDLDHPEAEGTLMKPVFFVTGQKLDAGMADQERRENVADWITSRKNHWFAKAFVNRMWAELVGRGFYEPVDDIGPDRSCSAPQTLDYLADRFAGSQYDVKWLFRTITATDAYARQSRSRFDESGAPFASNCPQRLRADQLYSALLVALDMPEGKREEDRRKDYRRVDGSPRGQVNKAFGYDPSERRDEIVGSIPQALFLMNGVELNRAITARGSNTMLGGLLESIDEDDAVVEELYLRCLARDPNDEEVETCLEYVKSVGNRAEAFEDIAWSLVNSTEFLNRK